MVSSGNIWRIGIFVVLVVLASFQIAVMTEKTRYTYRVFEVKGKEYDSIEPQRRTFYSSDIDEHLHDKCELVTAIPLVETIQKNYGDDRYVTGLRPHTRTKSVMLVIRYPRKVRFYHTDFWE